MTNKDLDLARGVYIAEDGAAFKDEPIVICAQQYNKQLDADKARKFLRKKNWVFIQTQPQFIQNGEKVTKEYDLLTAIDCNYINHNQLATIIYLASKV